MPCYIGTDIGTSATKVVAFGANGEIIAQATKQYSFLPAAPGYQEQDPEQIFSAVVEGLCSVLQELSPALPAFIAFSSAMHSLIVLDESDRPLTPCITWADNRAAEVADRLRETETGRAFYGMTGVPVHPMSPLCKIIWLKENAPDVFEQAAKFTGIKEYVIAKLSSVFITDSSVAAATGLMNGNTLSWEPAILKYAGIRDEQLSRIVPADHSVASIITAALPLLPAGTPLFAGGSDGACATIGSGITDTSTMAVSIGTSGAARVLVNGFHTDPVMRTFCYHVKGAQYITGGATNNGAVVLDWLRDTILQRENDFGILLEEAAALEPGADGLLMLPYLLGERAPVWNAAARAAFTGLTMNHRPAHMLRAAMEGICFAVHSTGKILASAYPVKKIHASGGFINNRAWVQMLSDYSGLPVITGNTPEAAALGAVMLADPLAVRDPVRLAAHIYEPSDVHHRFYVRHAARMEKLYALLNTIQQDADNG